MSAPKELSPSFEPTEQNAQDNLPEGWLHVQSMDLDAQGVARKPDGKVVFAHRNGEFESMRKMDPATVAEFLAKWK